MAAILNVSHNKISRNSATLTSSEPILVSRSGVVCLSGYGISVRVDRGHLALEDGIGAERRSSRFSRIGHSIRRVVVVGSDGMVSFAALRWLADQGASFAMLDRDGTVLAITGPVRPSDARLRRAQALATQNDVGLEITRELISQKLAGQEWLVRNILARTVEADKVAVCKTNLQAAQTYDQIRHCESHGAAAYWSAWRELPITFPRNDLSRTPSHWLTFGTRKSLLTGSQRLATNPPNAILNYLYALLESECRLGLAALGLDPGMGFLHLDTPARDSMACDLMEAVRPQVDAYLLDLLQEPLRRSDFLEQRDGSCRLMNTFALRLTDTCQMWARYVGPLAEWVAKTLGAGAKTKLIPPTRLTQTYKRRAKGILENPMPKAPAKERFCRGCGATLIKGRTNCADCNKIVAANRMLEVAKLGRIIARQPEAQSKRSKTQYQHQAAARAWKESDQPPWLTEDFYAANIKPLLSKQPLSLIASRLSISLYYASDIRRGRVVPHPRHWLSLSSLVGLETTD